MIDTKTLLAVLLLATPALAGQPRTLLQHGNDPARPAAASPVQALMQSARSMATAGKTHTTLSYPYGLTVDAAGNLYAANLFGGVTVYNAKLAYQGAITAGVSIPAAVAVNFEGNIFIANNASNVITVYNPAWQQIATITDPNLAAPTNLYIDPDDDIWVLDNDGTVHTYLNDFTPLPTTQTGGTALGPWGSSMTVWGIASGNGGYIEDTGNRGQMIRNNPNFPYYFPSGSPLAGGETQDLSGQQYVTDFANNQVQIWTTDGTFQVGLINTPSAPIGVAVDTLRNRIYVALPELSEIIVYSRVAPFRQLTIIH